MRVAWRFKYSFGASSKTLESKNCSFVIVFSYSFLKSLILCVNIQGFNFFLSGIAKKSKGWRISGNFKFMAAKIIPGTVA